MLQDKELNDRIHRFLREKMEKFPDLREAKE